MSDTVDQTLLPAFPTHMGIRLEEATRERVVGVFPVDEEHATAMASCMAARSWPLPMRWGVSPHR